MQSINHLRFNTIIIDVVFDAWHIGLLSNTDRHLSIQFDACIQDLVRCVALTRLVYGDGHLKLAQAHARLAKAYFQFKGKFKKTEYIVNYHLRLIRKAYGIFWVMQLQFKHLLFYHLWQLLHLVFKN